MVVRPATGVLTACLLLIALLSDAFSQSQRGAGFGSGQPSFQTSSGTSQDFSASPFLAKSWCSLARQEMQRLESHVSTIWPRQPLAIGEAVEVRYHAPRPQVRFPAFLIFSFDQPVRFRGDGFYVLAPGAKGAFGSSFRFSETRVVVPMFPRDRAEAGRFSFIPLTLSKIHLRASIVAQTGCGEISKEVVRQTFALPNVQPPKVFVFDQYGGSAPKTSFVSPAGDRYIDVFEDYFRIVAASTNAPVAEIPGRFPRFSPTGRFVTAEFANGVRVFDAVDGGALGAVGYSVAWDVGDSFVIGDHAVWGRVEVRSPFIEPDNNEGIDPRARRVGIACHYCEGINSVKLKLDLENNFLIGLDNAEFGAPTEYAVSLTTPLADDQHPAALTVAAQSAILPTKLPNRWETRSPLRFTNLFATRNGRDTRELEGSDAHVAAHFMVKLLPRSLPQATDHGSDQQVERLITRLSTEYGLTPANVESYAQEEEAIFGPENGIGTKLGIALPTKDILRGGLCGDAVNPITEEAQDAEIAHVWRPETRKGPILIGYGCEYGTSGHVGMLGAVYSSEKGAQTIVHVPFLVAYDEAYSGGGGCGGDCGFEAQLVDQRHVLAWSRGNSSIAAYDTETNSLVAFKAYHGRLIERVFLTSDHTKIIQINRDGTFAIYSNSPRAAGRRETIAAMSIGGIERVSDYLLIMGRYDDDEIVVWVPQGYYDASYEASRQIMIKFDGVDSAFDVSQFAATSLRPNLLRSIIDGQQLSGSAKFEVPPIAVATFANHDGDRLGIKIDQRGGGRAYRALVYQDGFLTDQIDLAPGKQSWNLDVARKATTRWMSVVVSDVHGLTSVPQVKDLGKPARNRDLNVLLVAIDDYSSPELERLRFSKTDAFSFSQSLGAFAQKNGRNITVDGKRLAEHV